MKYFILLPVFILLHSDLFSQAPPIQWQKSLGGLDWDASRQVRPMPDGGYMITAFTNSFDGDVVGNHGNDMWIYKVDSVGNIVWQHCMGGSGWEEPYDLHPTPDGGFIIAGESDSEDGEVEMNHGERDFWIVKTNDVGNIEWQKKYGGSLREIPYGLEFTSDGGYIICGKTFSNDGDVTGHHGPEDEYDIWIIRIDSVGNLIWQKSYGGSREEIARDIAPAGDGNFIIYGWCESTDGDVVGLHGEKKDYWLFKIDGDGNMLWQKCYGGTNDEFGYSMGIDTIDQTIFLGGYARSNDGDISGNHGGFSDGWVVKTDIEGNLIWQKCYGGSGRDYSRYIYRTGDHGAMMSAYSSSNDGDLTVHYGEDYQADYWLVKIDSNSVMQWQETIGGSDNDECYGLSMTLDSGYIVTGWSVNDDIDLTYNHGYRDVWLVKLEKPCTQNQFYADADNDGYGDVSNYTYSCDAELTGYVLIYGDCDDGNNAIHPGTEDICNAIDDDCDGIIDDDAIFTTYYADSDEDGYGDELLTAISCDGIPPVGYVSDNSDCNDGNFNINPGITEICNYIDDNCDELIDEDFLYVLSFADNDGDLFGDANTDSLGCFLPGGFVSDSTDCNDNNPLIYPGAVEILNGVDDDCDEFIDEDLAIDDNLLSGISIYPNPVSDELHITSSSHENIYLAIYNSEGKIIFNSAFSSSIIISTKYFSAGIYFAELKIGERINCVSFMRE